ncbi:MAG: Crp/Fnr family transcriptional regulator [Bacteroidetes bacterium]|nr:MAG: Crp/Fnr family transcriptional regulator [Bacteroidota bacterium]
MQALLERHFPDFEPALRQEILQVASLHHASEGQQLIRTGQHINATFLIVKGLVKLYREGDDGNEFLMYHLLPGEACALSMVCALKNETSHLMAYAVEDTEVILIPIGHMDRFMRTYKSWYYFVLETYRSRFEELIMTVDNIAFRAMDERLIVYLDQQTGVYGSRDLHVTHQQIADDLNSSREVISRLLKKLEQRQVIRLHRSHIEVLSPHQNRL